MNAEKKYIIVKVRGRLYHYTSDYADHLIIARDHSFRDIDIIEKGILSDGLKIWECYDKKHLHKIKSKTPGRWLGYDIDDYEQTLRKEHWLK